MDFYKDCFILQDFFKMNMECTLLPNRNANVYATIRQFKEKYNLTDWEVTQIGKGDMEPSRILEIGKLIELVEGCDVNA